MNLDAFVQENNTKVKKNCSDFSSSSEWLNKMERIEPDQELLGE